MKKELQNHFSWSVSRDATFHECARRYYFRHYGHWGGWEKSADPRTREIYVLGKLGNRWTWVGQVVHECIARSLRNLSRGIAVLDLEDILRITRNRMRQDFRQSRSGMYWQNPKEFFGMFEHEYKIEVSDGEWKAAADSVDEFLRTFYSSEVYQKLSRLVPEDFLEVEQPAPSDFFFEGTRMRIKLDAATRDPQDIIVWDWKTGRKESTTGTPLQMACYALYAQQRFNVPLRHIITRRFDLYNNRVIEQRINQKQLTEIASYIQGSIKDMLSLLDDRAKNTATESNFRKVERTEVCSRCNFLLVCKPKI